MKKTKITLLLILLTLIFPSPAFADIPSTGWTGHGLYLLKDDNIYVNSIEIDIIINNDQTTTVEAKYELENKEDNTISVYMGVPEHEVELQNFTSKVLPYRYGNKKVSGSAINSQIKDLKVNYNNWRTWYAPFQAKEKRTVEFTYKVDNKYISEGRYLISYQMDHIKSWKGKPQNVHVKIHFEDKEVKIYNFGSEFSVQPKVKEDFTLEWSFKDFAGNESIDFDYYFVNDEIIKYLEKHSSSKIKNITNAYVSKDYPQVIQLGKEYLQSSEGGQLQREIYFLMADAYERTGQPEESLIVYQLIEGNPGFHEGIQEKMQQLITYNRVLDYYQIEDYKQMYRLLSQVKEDPQYSFIYKDWAEKQMKTIPTEELNKIIEEEREYHGIEKIIRDFTNGVYNNYILIGLGGLIGIGGAINMIRKKKNDKKSLFKK